MKGWIDRVEAEYGMPLDEFLRMEAAAARETGTSMVMLAEDIGVPIQTLRETAWILGVRWPKGVSARLKAIPRPGGIPLYYATIDGVRAPVREHAERMGISVGTVKHRIRSGMTPEQALLTPLKQRGGPRKAGRGITVKQRMGGAA